MFNPLRSPFRRPALACLGVALLTLLPSLAQSQNAITLSDLTIDTLAETPGTVLVSTDAPASSVFLSITFDPQSLIAGSITATGVAVDAEGALFGMMDSTLDGGSSTATYGLAAASVIRA